MFSKITVKASDGVTRPSFRLLHQFKNKTLNFKGEVRKGSSFFSQGKEEDIPQ